jgi:hypothetical protein
LTANPGVVGNGAQVIVSFVEIQDGAKSIFQIVSTGWLQSNTVKLKPTSPKGSSKPVDMPIERAAAIIPPADIDGVLDVEIDDRQDARCGQKGWDGVYD